MYEYILGKLNIIHSNVANTAEKSSNKIGYIYDTDTQDYAMKSIPKHMNVYYEKNPTGNFDTSQYNPNYQAVDTKENQDFDTAEYYSSIPSISSDESRDWFSDQHSSDQHSSDQPSAQSSDQHSTDQSSDYSSYKSSDQHSTDQSSDYSSYKSSDYEMKQLIQYSIDHSLNNIYDEIINLCNVKKYISQNKYDEIQTKIHDIINKQC